MNICDRASGWAVGDRIGRGAQEVDHAATPARGAPARAVVALAGWPTRAPGAGLGGAGPTRAAALAGRAATVAVLASAGRTTGARHLGRLGSYLRRFVRTCTGGITGPLAWKVDEKVEYMPSAWNLTSRLSL